MNTFWSQALSNQSDSATSPQRLADTLSKLSGLARVTEFLQAKTSLTGSTSLSSGTHPIIEGAVSGSVAATLGAVTGANACGNGTACSTNSISASASLSTAPAGGQQGFYPLTQAVVGVASGRDGEGSGKSSLVAANGTLGLMMWNSTVKSFSSGFQAPLIPLSILEDPAVIVKIELAASFEVDYINGTMPSVGPPPLHFFFDEE